MSLEVAVTISGPSVIAGTGLGWVEDGETLRPQDISYGPHGQQSTTSFPSPPPLPPHCLIKNIWKFNWEVSGTLFDILSKLTKWEEIFLLRVLNTAESEVSSSGCLSENISPLLLISRLSTSCDWCPFYADISKPNFREFLSPPFDKFKILLKFSKKNQIGYLFCMGPRRAHLLNISCFISVKCTLCKPLMCSNPTLVPHIDMTRSTWWGIESYLM